jgi:hypothetical protein
MQERTNWRVLITKKNGQSVYRSNMLVNGISIEIVALLKERVI